MSIRYPTRVLAVMCVALVATAVGRAAAQVQYPAYGVAPSGFGSGGVVVGPHPRDLYNGATVATPGTFLDRFRQLDSTTGPVPCDPIGAGFYGQARHGVQTPQFDRLGTFHDRFADARQPVPSEPSPGGSGLNATAGSAAGCR